MDAIDVPSGRMVCIKRVRVDRAEHTILKTDSEDPRNHCVPLLESFQDGSEKFLVMPYLHPIDKPPFETLGDVVDFVSQLLEVRCTRSLIL